MKFDVHNLYTGEVQFTADIDCAEDASNSTKLRLAILWAVENKTDLKWANLKWANLRGAYLNDANLRGANLSEAYLDDANLRGANLSEAYLDDANLSGADLRWANLSGANLRGANLSGAYLNDANLRGAKSIISFGPVGRERRIGYAVKHEDGPKVQLGCFWGSLDAAAAAIRAKYGENSTYESLVRAACAALD